MWKKAWAGLFVAVLILSSGCIDSGDEPPSPDGPISDEDDESAPERKLVDLLREDFTIGGDGENTATWQVTVPPNTTRIGTGLTLLGYSMDGSLRAGGCSAVWDVAIPGTTMPEVIQHRYHEDDCAPPQDATLTVLVRHDDGLMTGNVVVVAAVVE